MDSRIREIEQWVAEAKAGLDDCGRDAYLNKLYLLDAEIRAVIKENGINPAVSPRRKPGSVRHLAPMALTVAGSLTVLVLLAATVYLAIQQGAPGQTLPPAPIVTAGADPAATQPATAAPVVDGPWALAYIPASIAGEEILGPGWQPPAPVGATPAELPAVAANEQPAPSPASSPVMAAAPAPGKTTPGGKPQPAKANMATSLVALAPTGQPAPAPVASQPAGNGGGTGTGTASTAFLDSGARHTVAAKFSYFPEAGTEPETPINQTKEQLGNQILGTKTETPVVDNVDNSDTAKEASVDNPEPELDSSALAELLEEKISQRSKR